MTLDHGSLGPEDVRTVMRAGVSKQAIQEAIEVAFLFNIYDRLADAMGWDVPPLAGGVLPSGSKKTAQTWLRLIERLTSVMTLRLVAICLLRLSTEDVLRITPAQRRAIENQSIYAATTDPTIAPP
jgi:hypothetical protein